MQFELLPAVPAVHLARELRRTPLFSFASVDELFRFAAIARQVRHTEGSTFQRRGAPPEYIQVLIEGAAIVSTAREEEECVGPTRLFGFREVLEGVPLVETARAKETSICLAMEAEDFRTLVSDNIELAEGVFRMLLGGPSAPTSPSLRKGVVDPASLKLAPDAGQRMRPLDKALLLRAVPAFSHTRAEEIMGIVEAVRETALAPGASVFNEGDPPSIWIVLAGTIALESSHRAEPLSAGAGDVLGVEETLSGRAMGWRGRVTEPGKALKVEREELFEQLALRTDFLQGVFGGIFQSTSSSTKGTV